MRLTRPLQLAFAVAASTAAPLSAAESNPATWGQWRGPGQSGVAAGPSLSPVSDLTVAWQTAVPGRGGSTPAVAGDQIFLTTGADGQNRLMAFDAETGQPGWDLPLGPDRGNKHRKGGGSNPSPVTDGQTVAAYFRSGDLAGVGVDGTLRWQVNLQDEFGEDTLWWDLGSSPVLVDGMVVVAVMQTGPSYLVAYDLTTGQRRWKVDRLTDAPEEAAQSYATPIVVQTADRRVLAVMGADTLTLHAIDTGAELARLGGFNPDGEKYFRSIASPVADGSRILCPYSRGSTLTCVDADRLLAGGGSESILWHRDDLGSDVPTPAARRGAAVLITDGKGQKAAVVAVDFATGKQRWRVELPRTRAGYSSSPLVLDDYVVTLSEHAELTLVGPLSAEKPAVVQNITLPDAEPFTVASPVPVAGGLLLRTHQTLMRLAAAPQ